MGSGQAGKWGEKEDGCNEKKESGIWTYCSGIQNFKTK